MSMVNPFYHLTIFTLITPTVMNIMLWSWSTGEDIGVDVEELGRKIRFDAFAQHAFHADEYKTATARTRQGILV